MNRRFDPDDPELMDRPQPVSPALERDLANLRSLNKWFGASRIIRKILGPSLRSGRPLNIVDLASGSGDLPLLMVEIARHAGTPVRIDAVDAHPATLSIGQTHTASAPEITWRLADIRAWQPDAPPDWVVCSLALHHFTEPDALTILRRMREMSGGGRGGVLLADLERSAVATAGIFAASVFYREPMTREDMRRSALAAFTFAELRAMADAAGWPPTRAHRRFFYGRQALWISPTSSP